MIIGLSGKSGVGKDTLADILLSRRYLKVSFAAPLKQLANQAFRGNIYFNQSGTVKDIPLDELNGNTKRDVLLYLDGLKRFDPNIFFDYTKSHYYSVKSCIPDYNYVFSDVRYDYEADWIVNELGGIIINIIENNVDDYPLIPSKDGTYMYRNTKDGNKVAWIKYIANIQEDLT